MQKVKKLLVVIPLVLVMILGSFPVFAKSEKKEFKVEVEMEVRSGLIKREKYTVKIKEDDLEDKTDEEIKNMIVEKAMDSFMASLDPVDRPVAWKVKYTVSGGLDGLTIEIDPNYDKDETVYTVTAVFANDTSKVITGRKFKPYEVASSLYTAVEEFKRLEEAKLKGLKLVKSNPIDINKNSGSTEAILYYEPENKPLTVIHILKGRAPLGEVLFIPSDLVMTERVGIDIAKTRIEQVNNRGYKFERAIYDDGLRRNPLIKEYYDLQGKKIAIKDSEPVLYLYYDAVKVVDATKIGDQGTANNTQQQTTAILTPQTQPVTANTGEQLPSTGVADYSFLFISAAAMMAAGIFMAKRK